jgi:hypothetical protein
MKKYDVKVELRKLIMMEFKDPIKMSKIGKKMSQIPLVMKIIIVFDWRMELSSRFVGIRILILISIGEKNHFRFSLVHEG